MKTQEQERETMAQAAEALGLEVRATFVPWSQSRGYKAKAKIGERTLNWKVTVLCKGREVLTTDYGAGIAHASSYSQRAGRNGFTLAEAEALEYETEHGKRARVFDAVGLGIVAGAPILPDPLDVLSCLALDASALDYSGYEEWAPDCGYDPDSRKGENVYRECLGQALKLRNALGDAGLQRLREAAQDY